MKTSERFNRALNRLVKAYMNDTLNAGKCTACAVGSMCGGDSEWRYAVWAEDVSGCGRTQRTCNSYHIPSEYDLLRSIKRIKLTGYTPHQLALVENAFMNHCISPFRGLMAVVDVLCEIEGINDPSPYKEMFEGKELTLAQGIGND